jgi:ubiquinone/menaquinone biosynthesis C-methylase UbiE
MPVDRKSLQQGYSEVAGKYAEQYLHELDHKPLDRELLQRFAREVSGEGPVCDMGCGPGQIARYLYDCGVTEVFGIDFAEGMVAVARQSHPPIRFEQGDMLSLAAADSSWAGIAAFYSIIHIPREDVTRALCEMKRVLQPRGLLFLTFHVGDDTLHVEEMWGERVSIDFVFFRQEEMEDYLTAVGFRIEESIQRRPYDQVEYPSRRVYIFARKPEL